MSGGEPVVSVVLASNGSNRYYLMKALASVDAQDGVSKEVVLILDGVPDEVVSELKTTCLTTVLRVYGSNKKRGLARCLNVGIRLSRGRYIARMDDDDVCLPERLSIQVEALERDELDVIGTSAFIIDELGVRTGEVIHGADFSGRISPYKLLFSTLLIHPSVLFRRTWALRNRYRRSWGRGQDRELWIRSYGSTRFGSLEVPLLEYRRGAALKAVQLDNVSAAFRLLYVHWRKFGYWTLPLAGINTARYLLYRARLLFA